MPHFSYLSVLCLLAIGNSAFAAPKAGTMEGKIHKFQCGDNCYLTIIDSNNKEHGALCIAPECAPWNKANAMPSRFKGQGVVVTLGRGVQMDSAGNVLGRMNAFKKIQFRK
jgi:hypothetical protein